MKARTKKRTKTPVKPSSDTSVSNTVFDWSTLRVHSIDDKRRKIIIGAIKQLAELL